MDQSPNFSEYEKKILIVEDNTILRELYEELLKSEGYGVVIASDGEKGLAAISQGGYDLVLLDIMLPLRDGVDILKQLDDHPPLVKNGPIVILSNLGQEEIIKECFNHGATGYLIKSALSPDQVLQEVERFLKQKPNNEDGK